MYPIRTPAHTLLREGNLRFAVAFGVPGGAAAYMVGSRLGVAVGVLMVLTSVLFVLAVVRVRVCYVLPGLYGGAVLHQAIDPAAAPPQDARPVSLGVAERWVRAVNARDWRTARQLLDRGVA